MSDHFGVGLGREFRAFLLQLLAQLAIVLDDAVVNHRETIRGVGMRVALVRLAMRRPARVTDTRLALERLLLKLADEVGELAFGAPARQPPRFQRRDAGGVVAAIGQILQRIDELHRDWLAPEYADDPAHAS